VDVNSNGTPGIWYKATNARLDGGTTTIDGEGSIDWMESGRLNAYTLWAEDLFPNQESGQWSFTADALRSAAMEGSGQFGGYVHGVSLGGERSGASYRILSLIGHGAKTVDLYTFRPGWDFSDRSSERTDVYGGIADALALVGRSEDLLYPGRPERGKVAILLAGAGTPWDDANAFAQYHLYEAELPALHAALVHAGYTVDLVDDTD